MHFIKLKTARTVTRRGLLPARQRGHGSVDVAVSRVVLGPSYAIFNRKANLAA